MKSTLCFPETPKTSDSVYNNDAIEACIAKAWVDLVATDIESLGGDDWLYLCGDIDDGEIYLDWFLWQDTEVTQEWEAFDFLTDFRLVAANREALILKIDQIEADRKQIPMLLAS
ncbi:MAG TPA: hypothetical protein VK211_16450 [Kamptonema sp.]|nr:hypothetical protein [Kamptonema sp.]